MNQMRTAILELDSQKLPSLGDAFATVCQRFGHTAKPVSDAFGLDKKTAVNALDRKAGVPAISKALLTRQKIHDDHYDLALAMLAMIFGETHDQYEERKLQTLIESTAHAQSLLAARQDRRRSLRARSTSPDSRSAYEPRLRRLD